MAITAGWNGVVKIGANTIAQVKEASLDLENNMEDSTVIGDRASDQAPTTYKVGIKAKVNYDLTDTNGQKAIQDAWINATTLTVVFSPAGTSVTNGNYSISCYVGKLSISTSPDKIVGEDIEFAPTGALTIS